ncbi:superoxide dismutase [Sediminispirochaeta smaragdinae]|uniref:Superoxide dismutase n=1 Tax=Sediminispirochaeta smaragdinae (strain DSM 11293 / JCM 15392 / SEBR 4228) TaxID=573413 RepID=E1RBS5_SEDSS|nr:superoxide dismutase [Sediminispirochaeta smaragdinae]ADK79805.1 Manganese/iron superoxide dismutase [Sediminispirochaeta smaragdinae DSM 11293]
MSFITPDLPYAYDALEPYIDERTMRVHHDKHHAGYTAKLNNAVEGTVYAGKSIEELLAGLDALPENIRTGVRNNGGGHYNHSLFWKVMGPKGGGKPEGALAEKIDSSFGGFDVFISEFSAAAASRFGSGWAWLAVDPNGSLSVLSTANQDSPLTQGLVPILGLDVWEHAYYLKYQNRRPEYIESFFKVINWPKVAELYKAAI